MNNKNIETVENKGKLKQFWAKHKGKIILVSAGAILGGIATFVGYKYGYDAALEMCKKGCGKFDTALQKIIDSYGDDPHTGRTFTDDLTAFLDSGYMTSFMGGEPRAMEEVFTKDFIDAWNYAPAAEGDLVSAVGITVVKN